MRELRHKQAIKRWLYSIPSLILLIIITFLLARGAAAIMGKAEESGARLKELEVLNASLKARQETLDGEIARLQSEEGVIEEIREKFNVTREGEHLAIVVTEAPVAIATTTPWYWRIWNVILKRK